MKRLLEGSLSPRAATLLRSASADVPPRAAEAKARLASAVASEVAPPASGRMSSGKWLGAVSLAVVVAASAIGAGHHLITSASPPSSSTPIDALPAALPPASPAQGTELATPSVGAATPAPPKSVDVMDLPSAPVARPQTARPVGAASAERVAEPTARASSDAASLSDELKAIDEARAAFVEHNPRLAIDRVDAYRRRFPAGHFTDEADALEIQALVALDRNDEARRKAERFLAARPSSPYAQRVRSAIGAKK